MSDNNSTVPAAPESGGYQWRRDRGLLTISDMIRRYAAVRHPRGPYRVPMVDDYLPCWRPSTGGPV